MRARTSLLTFICATLVATAAPAPAEDVAVFGVNNGLAGLIANVYEEEDPAASEGTRAGAMVDPPDKELKKFRLAGKCSFNGVLTPNGTLVVNTYGTLEASGPVGRPVPLLTAVACEINNFTGGGTNQLWRDFSLNGPESVVADSTALSATPEWPVLPITVCVWGFAIYGPTPVYWVNMKKKCQTPDGEEFAAQLARTGRATVAVG